MEEEFRKLESENNWKTHFDNLFKKSRRHSADAGYLAANKPLNRYLDVVPYDKSRVRLSRTSGTTDYINANLVTVPKAARQYILTQGPLPETVAHFWLMVWEQKSNVIVMLNRCVEMEGINKCEQYWPGKVNSTKEYADVKLAVTMTKVSEEKHYTARHILLNDLESHKKREVLQFQYKAWPDFDQPNSVTSFLRLLAAIRKSGGLDKMDEPSIVHCSAGIGRSGTFCLIDSILSMVENQGTTEGIDIANTLIEMRDYRFGLIQSEVQLRFAYMAIIQGIKILEKANKLQAHMSSITPATDAASQQKTNGSASMTNGKKSRRAKNRKQSAFSNPSTLNVFNKHLLVEALDDIDSDTADALHEDAMVQLPSLKKPRNSAPDDFNDELMKQLDPLLNSTVTSPADSVLVRRREREMRNQRLAEKTQDIKGRMKDAELRHSRTASRIAFLKKSALLGAVSVIVSSLAYAYFHRSAPSWIEP